MIFGKDSQPSRMAAYRDGLREGEAQLEPEIRHAVFGNAGSVLSFRGRSRGRDVHRPRVPREV